MPTYQIFADVVEGTAQNVQEWTTTWGEIRTELEDLDAEIVDSYAVLGDHDFQITYRVDDHETAIQAAIAVERHGLDTRTHQLVEIERMGELVEDH